MDFFQPTSLTDALALKAEHPDAWPIQGGTDLMVDINFDRLRPSATIDLNRVEELQQIERVDDGVWVGAGVPMLRIMRELSLDAPGLVMAARTVGSPQIRARATLGGNLGTASPAGDTLPMLTALNARVEVASAARATREIEVGSFIVRPRKSALESDELIVRIFVPCARGAQQFVKVGQRNAMVISIASFGLVLDAQARSVRTGIGSAGPKIMLAKEAEEFAARSLDWDNHSTLNDETARQFGDLVSEAASPIDDVRSSARYRRHALSVVGRRALSWAWDEQRALGLKEKI